MSEIVETKTYEKDGETTYEVDTRKREVSVADIDAEILRYGEVLTKAQADHDSAVGRLNQKKTDVENATVV